MGGLKTMHAEKSSLPPAEDTGYDAPMEARVAVLEQIAKDTKEVLAEMRQDMRDIRQETKEFRQEFRLEIKDTRRDQKIDFRLQFSATITVTLGLAYLMARGFHWL